MSLFFANLAFTLITVGVFSTSIVASPSRYEPPFSNKTEGIQVIDSKLAPGAIISYKQVSTNQHSACELVFVITETFD